MAPLGETLGAITGTPLGETSGPRGAPFGAVPSSPFGDTPGPRGTPFGATFCGNVGISGGPDGEVAGEIDTGEDANEVKAMEVVDSDFAVIVVPTVVVGMVNSIPFTPVTSNTEK